jgi:hypothetical protein
MAFSARVSPVATSSRSAARRSFCFCIFSTMASVTERLSPRPLKGGAASTWSSISS